MVTNSCSLHIENFSSTFDRISCQPSNAAVTHRDVVKGLGFAAKIPPKTLEYSFSKKTLSGKQHLHMHLGTHEMALVLV